MKRASISAQCALVLVLLTIPLCPAVPAQEVPGLVFPPFGLREGETARLNVLNLGSGRFRAPSSCTVDLQFVEATGRIIKEDSKVVQAGKIVSSDFSYNPKTMERPRTEIYAKVLFGAPGGANPAPQVQPQRDCNVVPSLEVFRSSDAATVYVITTTSPLPAVSGLPAIP